MVARRSTPHNPVLEVVDLDGHRMLNAASVNYSFGSLQRVFEDAFALLRLAERRIESALVLGYGAGNVADLLRRGWARQCRIVGVEIDAEVVALAREHFPLVPGPDVEIVIADAAEWLDRASERFDLVVVDLFVDDKIPDRAQSPGFLRAAAGRLERGGLLLYNRMADTGAAMEESRRFALQFAHALGGVREIAVGTNVVLAWERPA